jgi:hypothetical protein
VLHSLESEGDGWRTLPSVCNSSVTSRKQALFISSIPSTVQAAATICQRRLTVSQNAMSMELPIAHGNTAP